MLLKELKSGFKASNNTGFRTGKLKPSLRAISIISAPMYTHVTAR